MAKLSTAKKPDTLIPAAPATYGRLLGNIDTLVLSARHHTARAVNACMTATYWHVGRYIVEFEQRGADRAKYGDALLQQLADDLSTKHGRGFSKRNLHYCCLFYTTFDYEWIYKATTYKVSPQIVQTLSAQSSVDSQQVTNQSSAQTAQLAIAQNDSASFAPIRSTLSNESSLDPQHVTPPPAATASATTATSTPTAQPTIAPRDGASYDLAILARAFPLPWSHYVMLISRSRSPEAREFYHAEALRGAKTAKLLAKRKAEGLKS